MYIITNNLLVSTKNHYIINNAVLIVQPNLTHISSNL